MRNILFIFLFTLFQSTLFSQSVRFNLENSSIGIQTPHTWNIYAHTEAKLFRIPFAPNIHISTYDFQLGYTWINAKRGSFRSAINNTIWFLSPDDNKQVNNFWNIIPLAFALYPLERDYIGFDLYLVFDPYDITISPGLVLLVKLD